jgi:WD40 repeat protein
VTAEGANDALHLRDGESGKEVAVLRTPALNSVLFSPDGSRLGSASDFPDITARLWDAATGRLLAVLAGHKNRITGHAFGPDGRRMLTASWDQTARRWDGRTGQLLAVVGAQTGRVGHVLFSPNGTRVVTAGATLCLWDAQTDELIGVLRGHGDEFFCPPVFTPDGTSATASCAGMRVMSTTSPLAPMASRWRRHLGTAPHASGTPRPAVKRVW